MLLLVAISLISIGALAHYRRYYAVFVLIVATVYEISVPIAYYFGDNETYKGLTLVIPGINDRLIEEHINTAILFILSFVIGLGLYRPSNRPLSHSHTSNLDNITVITGIMFFVFGSISLLKGGGVARVAQYIQDADTTVTPFHFYTIAVAPIAWFFTVKSYFDKNFKRFLILCIASTPAMIDLFIAGRRQMFVPLIFYIIFFALTQTHITKSKKYLGILSVGLAGAVIFAIQFVFRFGAAAEIAGKESTSSNYEGDILLPQIIEFMFSGATSSSAIRDFIFYDSTPPLGLDSWLAHISQAIPIIGGGISSFMSAGTPLEHYAFTDIAPHGALTILAEGVVFFGIYGAFIYGIATGYLCGALDHFILKCNNHSAFDYYPNIIIFCIAAIVLFKYRSGVADAAQNAALTSLLFVLIYIASISWLSIRKSLFSK